MFRRIISNGWDLFLVPILLVALGMTLYHFMGFISSVYASYKQYPQLVGAGLRLLECILAGASMFMIPVIGIQIFWERHQSNTMRKRNLQGFPVILKHK